MPFSNLKFDYSSNPLIISILQNIVNKSGWLIAKNLTVSTFETEDYIILSGITDDGLVLEPEQCTRLFSLNAIQENNTVEIPTEINNQLVQGVLIQQNAILEDVGVRNVAYFELELEKLDNWGDDKRNSLKVTLKELDDLIKDLKKQVRLAPNLPEKLKLEKERRKLETERDNAWRDYDGAAKEIELNKDRLIDKVEHRLKQDLKEEDLFFIKWELI